MKEYREKRVYETLTPDDGFRVYVDRIWPRGLSHATFKYDFWDKEIAPTAELRRWFHEDTQGRWEEFEQKYMEELESNQAMVKFSEIIALHPVVTLLYSSKDMERNNATVLKNFLENNSKSHI